MAAPIKLRLATRAYDGTLPILRGQMSIPGIEFEITESEDVPALFAGMFKGQYDIGEMSLAELIYYTSRGNADFVGIPVFPSRMFRHGFIFVRKDSGISQPGDLNGKRLGFLRWVQTAAIWMRGMLAEEYGVSVKDSAWYVAATHHWDDHDPAATVEPRDGWAIQMIDNGRKSTAERAYYALVEGQVDALGVTESQLPNLLAATSVKRLFENARGVEAAYYRRTRILPIMHVLTVQKQIVERYPELPEQLFRLYADAKRWARRWRRAIPSLVEAWPNHYITEENEIFKSDPWAYGLDENRHVLEKFFHYCYAQGVSGREIRVEEIFCPSTLKLSES